MGYSKGFAIGVMACLASACSNLPPLPDAEYLSINEVVDTVQCELKQAVVELQGGYPFLSKWGVGAGLTLVTEDKGQFSPELTSVVPILRESNVFGATDLFRGAATIGFGLDKSETIRRTVNLKIAFSFEDLKRFQCTKTRRGPHVLTSDLGIREWLGRSLSAIGKDDVVGDPLSIGTTIQFSALMGAKLEPRVALMRVAGPGANTPGAVLSANRTSDHTLDLTFSPLPSDPGPVRVIIVGRGGR